MKLKQYLNESAETLMPGSKPDNIQHTRTMETPGGFKVHFNQYAEGYPVYGTSTVISINRKNKVVFVSALNRIVVTPLAFVSANWQSTLSIMSKPVSGANATSETSPLYTVDGILLHLWY